MPMLPLIGANAEAIVRNGRNPNSHSYAYIQTSSSRVTLMKMGKGLFLLFFFTGGLVTRFCMPQHRRRKPFQMRYGIQQLYFQEFFVVTTLASGVAWSATVDVGIQFPRRSWTATRLV